MTDRPEPRSMTPEERDAKIAALLAEGRCATFIARTLAVSRNTVQVVRARPEVHERIVAARQARTELHEAMIEDSRRILRETASDAAYALADAVMHADPNVRLRAAREVLDRIGVPRIEEVRTRSEDLPDLSALTDEELAAWEALNAKVSRR